MAGNSPVVIASSPPTAGQLSTTWTSSPLAQSPNLLSSSPSQQLPSPSTFGPPRSTNPRRGHVSPPPQPDAINNSSPTAVIPPKQVCDTAFGHGSSSGGAFGSRPEKSIGFKSAGISECAMRKQDGDFHEIILESRNAACNALTHSTSACGSAKSPQRGDYNDSAIASACSGNPNNFSASMVATKVSKPQDAFAELAQNSWALHPVSRDLVGLDVGRVGKARNPKARNPTTGSLTLRKSPIKSSRKRYTKSASFIVDSDEPDEVVEEETGDLTPAAQPSGWSALAPKHVHLTSIETKTSQLPEDTTAQKDLCRAPVMRRRRSWTPAKNTESATDQEFAGHEMNASPSVPNPQSALATLVSRYGLSNEESNAASPPRTATGEAVTKRRRIVCDEGSTVKPADPNPVKKPKAPKKRRVKVIQGPKTITAMATLAFQRPRAQPHELDTGSAFFANKDDHARDKPIETGHKNATRPSKSRTKSDQQTNKSKKAVAAKKSSLRSSGESSHPSLLPPSQARVLEQKQEFLFGTSSQLAVDESPTFIRQIRCAIQDSEEPSVIQAPTGPQQKSCSKVPTAPHGTSLSIEQADKGLWCTAARDQNGGVFQQLNEAEKCATIMGHNDLGLPSNICAHPDDIGYIANGFPRTSAQEIVDLSVSSPLPEPLDPGIPKQPTSSGARIPVTGTELEITEVPSLDERNFTPTRMLLPNGEANLEETHRGLPCPRVSEPGERPAHGGVIGFAESPSRLRNVLRNLDANIGLARHASPFKSSRMQQRALSSTTTKALSKTLSPNKPIKPPPPTTEKLKHTAPSPNKRRGRPPKSTLAPAPSDQERKATIARPQDSPSDYKDIDEISDSDVPPTPSPPRRKPSSSPHSSQPLDLRPAVLTTTTTTTTTTTAVPPSVATVSAPKAGSAEWASAQKELFPHISHVVKNAPRSDDLQHPSWHEKILLYDPIVLEDLTAWLNAQGLRIPSRRLKTVSKARGRRKKKDVAIEKEAAAATATQEYETCMEELKPWMVQQWCQEKSICCLWKEGLRGGVRTKY